MRKITKTWVNSNGYAVRICDMNDKQLKSTVKTANCGHPMYNLLIQEMNRRKCVPTSCVTNVVHP